MYLNHIRGSGNANGNTGRNHNTVAGMNQASILRRLDGHADELIGRMGIIHQQGSHAAVNVHLAACRFIQYAGNNGGIRTETAQQTGSFTALGCRNDGRSTDIRSRGAGRMADSGADGQAGRIHADMVAQGFIVGIALGGFGNHCHSFQGLYRILACGSFAGQHNGTGAVINGVGNVGNFCTGGAGVHYHGIQHLGCRDADFAHLHGMVNQVLLDGRDFGIVNFNAHIAAGNHNAIGNAQDLINIINAFLVLNFGNDADIGIMLIQQVADIHNILCAAGKTGGDQVIPLFNTKQDIIAVTLAHIRHGQVHTGNVDTLLRLDHTIIFHGADDIRIGNAFDAQGNQAIIQHNAATNTDIMRQVLVSDGADFLRALNIAGGQDEFLPSGQLLLAVLEFAQADLRAFGIQHCRNGNVKLFTQCAQLIQTAFVFRVIAMRKIEACNIHPVFQQLAQNAGLVGRRPQSTYNFSFAHKYPS